MLYMETPATNLKSASAELTLIFFMWHLLQHFSVYRNKFLLWKAKIENEKQWSFGEMLIKHFLKDFNQGFEDSNEKILFAKRDYPYSWTKIRLRK